MTRARKRQDRKRSWPVVLVALVIVGLLGSLSLILTTLHVHLEPVAATSSHGVTLLKPPRDPAAVSLPATARPISPNQPAAALPKVSSAKETATVANEDARIRAVLHDAARAYQPEVIPYRGSLPTLVLPAGSHTYTTADLVQYGAMVMLPDNAALLLDNVFVSANATLSFGSPLRTLYLDNTSGGFATIVGWDGNLSFTGTAAQPLTIVGWNRATSSAADDQGDGRSYLREVGGTMTLSEVRASSLGFWSGRTGGVSWTGVSAASSKGSAVNSTFTNDTYGAFVSRSQNVTFSADLFEFNQLDGLHIHRYSVGSQVISSSASRNGGNGFLIDRATQNTVLRGDVSQHNAANGYYIDGRPLVTGASASGGSSIPSGGTVLEDSAAIGNIHTGVLIEGGTGTVVKSDQICSTTTAIALRTGVTNAVLTGNDIRCNPRSGLSVGPSAPNTVISGNTLSGARVGMLIRNSGPVSVDNNRLIGATVFGVTARGASSKVSGVGNVISGTGFRAVDARADAGTPALAGTDTSGWAHRAKITFFSYLEFHPLAALWLGILVLIVLAAAWSFRRKLPHHPYPVSTRWGEPFPAAGRSTLVPEAGPISAPTGAPQPESPQPSRSGEDARPSRWEQPAVPAASTRPLPVPSRPRPTFTPGPSFPEPSTRAVGTEARSTETKTETGSEGRPPEAGQDTPERARSVSVFEPAPVRRPFAGPDPATNPEPEPWPEPASERLSLAWSRQPATRPQLALERRSPGHQTPDREGSSSPSSTEGHLLMRTPHRRHPAATAAAAAAAGILGIAVAGCSSGGQSHHHSSKTTPATAATPASAVPVPSGSATTAGCPSSGGTAVSTASALKSALYSARPGGTIVLAAGVYSGNFTAARSGTASAPITLCGSRGAILEGESTDKGYTFHLDHASWWRVEGFTVEGGQKGVVADGSDHDLLYGLYVHGIGDEAIHLRSASSDDTVSHCEVRDTGLHTQFFGEGLYVGSAHKNWCEYSNCQPDRSDDDVLIDNNIADTTAENIDIKEGTTGGKIVGNQFNGTGMVESAATGWINVKGNDWTIEDNIGVDSVKNGYQVHQVYPGWGIGNVFTGNRAQVNGPGYGIYVQSKKLQTVVACNNVVSAAAKGFSTVACSST